MDNLSTFLALEKLVQSIQHGKATIDFQIRAGKVVGITANGAKRKRYNSSNKDLNTNEVAVKDVIGRVLEQLASGTSGELTFKIRNTGEKIVSVEIESEQNMKI